MTGGGWVGLPGRLTSGDDSRNLCGQRTSSMVEQVNSILSLSYRGFSWHVSKVMVASIFGY